MISVKWVVKFTYYMMKNKPEFSYELLAEYIEGMHEIDAFNDVPLHILSDSFYRWLESK